MAISSRFFGEGKKQYQQKFRANQFIRMFANVSKELGLSGSALTRELVLSIFGSMGMVDSSADVFIQIVLAIHSRPEERGLLITKQLGRGVVNNIPLDKTLNNMTQRDISFVYKLLQSVVPDLEEMFEGMDSRIIREPLLLLLAFMNHVGSKRGSLTREPSEESFRDTLTRMGLFKRDGMVPALEIYKSDYNQIGKTKVATPKETVYL